jgi:dGTPase
MSPGQAAADWTARIWPEDGRTGAGSAFEIDRDRIIHCDTFRDLQLKTQVQTIVPERTRVPYRTRLNHVIEVAQIARGLAAELGADQALAEAIALAHDLGHPPFGHAGERAISQALHDRGHSGWNANVHSLVVVDRIECQFVGWQGLNLTLATREGIARHSTPFDRPQPRPEFSDFPQAGLEAQIVDFADVLAFLSHDLDDALTAGHLTLEDLREASPEIAGLAEAPTGLWDSSPWQPGEWPRLRRRRLVARLIGKCIRDIAATTQVRLGESPGVEAEPVRSRPTRVVAYSGEYETRTQALLALLRERYYGSDEVRARDSEAFDLMLGLFEALMGRREKVPERFLLAVPETELAVASYIASLTDLSALSLVKQLRA